MGNDIRFGIGIELGGNRGGHQHHDHGNDFPRFPMPGHPQQQPQWDPLTLEARQIAGELDRGQTQRAADHLREELQFSRSFGEQRRLVEMVDRFDQKGVGADLRLGRLDRQGGIWDDIRITAPRYYEPGYGNRQGNYGRPPVYNNNQPEIRFDLRIFKR